jgi:CNT family concentrative nucleoside transporter
VRGFSFVLERSFKVGGAVGLATAANVFVGMVEAPLFVRPYLLRLTRSELFILMTAGMATIAGTVFVLYAVILKDALPDAAVHLLVASVISAPAAIMVAMLMVPETGTPPPATRCRRPTRPAPWTPSSRAPSAAWRSSSTSSPC